MKKLTPNFFKSKNMNNIKLLEQQAEKLQQDLDKLKETISKEKSNIITIKDIADACTVEKALELSLKVLGEPLDKYSQYKFDDKQDEATYYLKCIIKAVNFLDNGNKVWDYLKTINKEYRYYPYFEFTGGSLVLFHAYDCGSISGVPLALQFKVKESCILIVNNLLNTLYKDYIKG